MNVQFGQFLQGASRADGVVDPMTEIRDLIAKAKALAKIAEDDGKSKDERKVAEREKSEAVAQAKQGS